MANRVRPEQRNPCSDFVQNNLNTLYTGAAVVAVFAIAGIALYRGYPFVTLVITAQAICAGGALLPGAVETDRAARERIPR